MVKACWEVVEFGLAVHQGSLVLATAGAEEARGNSE